MVCFGLHFHFYVSYVMMLWPTFVVLVVEENLYIENLCPYHPIKHGKGLLVRNIIGILYLYSIWDLRLIVQLILCHLYISLALPLTFMNRFSRFHFFGSRLSEQ